MCLHMTLTVLWYKEGIMIKQCEDCKRIEINGVFVSFPPLTLREMKNDVPNDMQ